MGKRLTKNLVLSILILAVTLAVVSGVAGYVTSQRVGQVAYAASALAAVVVWLAGSLGLLVTMHAPGNQASVTALLMAMLLRIGLPLGTVVILTQLGTQAGGDTPVGWVARLGEAGFFGLVVVHYLVALMIETVLSVRWLSRQSCFLQQPCHSLQERALEERVRAKAGNF